jgi:hypothetical protein
MFRLGNVIAWGVATALFAIVAPVMGQAPPATLPSTFFGIEVVDAQTGRGVPLVELKTVSSVRYYTDSAGWAAIDDPALMNHLVYFGVSSHGYEYPADGFGSRGTRVNVKAGGSIRIKIKRINIAERLYRITGEGIYRDSVLLARPVPIREPLLNAQVTGQDSNQPVVYRGKIHFFWGDTGRQSYPLGHFGMAGATADLPEKGGLDPSLGIDLHYFTGPDGFSRPMIPEPANRLRWADGMTVLKDGAGKEILVGRNSIMKSLGECVGMQLIIYNDSIDVFDVLKEIPKDAPLQPTGHPIRVEADGASWYYYGDMGPTVRCRADLEHFKDLSTYEGFTCLPAGARYKGVDTPLDRDPSGKLVWSWKRDTQPVTQKDCDALIRAGKMKADEAWLRPVDVETGKPITMGASSVNYNPYRKRYIAIGCQVGGSNSMVGEIWYSEAEKPEGPWRWARKIVTHNHYSFYNPVQDAFFDQDGGRIIYFEGTYTGTFSRNEDFTPRYDYNQIMYRLDLSDPRLRPTNARR